MIHKLVITTSLAKCCCAFTGHRPQSLSWGFNETDKNCLKLKELLNEQITKLADSGYTDFLSGMALGVDTWAAEIVLNLREKNPALKLHCILPCKTQALKWSVSAQERYNKILEQADSTVYISRNYYTNCILERNRFLVANATLLLAVYDERRKRSGTSSTLRYAQKLGRKIIIINPISLEITGLEQI